MEIDNRQVWPTWSTGTAVTGNHAPILIGRGVMLLLGTLYTQLQTYEPVGQLASGGISGSALAGSPFGVIDIGIFMGQVGTAFSAGSIYVDTNYCNATGTANDLNPCLPRIAVTPWVLDVILVSLIVQVLVIVYAISKWFKKPGGLSADPTTIAGVAVVMGHPEIERQFSSFPGEMTQAELKERLKDTTFKLGTFMTEAGVAKYGIMPGDEEDEKKKERNPNGIMAFFSGIGGLLTKAKEGLAFARGKNSNGFYFDCIFLMGLLAMLGLTIASVAMVDKPQTVFLATATASGIGMKIFFATLGIIISFYWGRLFRDAQTYTPYLPLRDGEARPNPTILLNRHSNPVTAIVPLLANRHMAAASVAFTGIIAELLIISLAGLPYRPGQLRSEFLFSGISAVAILVLMITQLVVFNFWQRSLPHLPRRPDNIAAVMTYVAGTHIVRDFNGLESSGVRQRNRAIRDMQKTYAYGWRREDERGRIRWVVDEVVTAERKSLLDRTSGERVSGDPSRDPSREPPVPRV